MQLPALSVTGAAPGRGGHPHPWALGEVSWWLRLGGGDRPAGAPLARPPDADSAAQVHREAHGLVADEIYPVAEGA